MSSWKIYHNPRCSKSRAALQALEDQGIDPEVVLYLKTPPSKKELKDLVRKLGVKPKEIVRTKEPLFRQLSLDLDNDAAVIDAIHEHPSLLERPIVVFGDKAVLGRPIDRVHELLQSSN